MSMHLLSLGKAGLTLCFFGFAGTVLACDGELLLRCEIDGRDAVLETCLIGTEVRYQYGPVGAPDLTLMQPVKVVQHTPWPGVGRWIWHVTGFAVGDVVYKVHLGIDRLSDPPGAQSAGVLVEQDGQTLADLSCVTETIEGAGDPSPLFAAKIAVGQIYDRDADRWSE